MYLFSGRRDHKIDGKDRVVIPSGYAAEVVAHGHSTLVLTPGEKGPFIEAYPGDVWHDKVMAHTPDRFDADLERKRQFVGNAEACEVNGPGRITIPERFRALFPHGEVRVVGMVTYLELWDPALWDAKYGTGIQGLPGGTPPIHVPKT
jgi:DNA-binding transcriptional regulator/RsmH inhibitor MraZ